jgi:hypothetical protein
MPLHEVGVNKVEKEGLQKEEGSHYRDRAWAKKFEGQRKIKGVEMQVLQIETTKSIVKAKLKRIGNLESRLVQHWENN